MQIYRLSFLIGCHLFLKSNLNTFWWSEWCLLLVCLTMDLREDKNAIKRFLAIFSGSSSSFATWSDSVFRIRSHSQPHDKSHAVSGVTPPTYGITLVRLHAFPFLPDNACRLRIHVNPPSFVRSLRHFDIAENLRLGDENLRHLTVTSRFKKKCVFWQ